jgi:hypothetical protein
MKTAYRVTQTVAPNLGHGRPATVVIAGLDTWTPEHREHPPQSRFKEAERGNPDGVWLMGPVAGPQGMDNPPAGRRTPKKRMPPHCKATGIHNRADRVIPRLKGC